ncbi:hypothetical protein B0H13DRAFT_2364147 [Mycena leptocephala]|nr:hypothetical protein B0H13DRAFT_2364147 [Mycena leptocephala]
MVVPCNDAEITNVYMAVRRMQPAYPGFAYGYLYATGSNRRRTVAVPYNYGVGKITSINDLFVHVWVPKPVPSSSVIDMGVGRILVDKFPNTRIPLEFAYTIIFVPSTYTLPGSVNKCPVFRCEKEWHGNILVVKHGKRKPVINMDAEDASLVDNIVNAGALLRKMAGKTQKKRKRARKASYEREGRRLRRRLAHNTVLANEFFHIPEMLLEELLPHCDLDVMFAISKTGKYARNIVKCFVAGNLRVLVEHFVSNEHVDAFYAVLETSLSAMAGSVVTSVLTPPYRQGWIPMNLNIILPRGHMFMWREFLEGIGLSRVKDQSGVDRKFHHTTYDHIIYNSKAPDYTIDLTESRDCSLMTPLIGATTTLSTNLATCANIYSLYTSLLTKRRALEGWFPTPVRKAVAMGRRGYRSSFSTASWQGPCGWACPVLWRNVRGLNGVGTFQWGGNTGQFPDNSLAGIPYTNNDMKWRLGDSCTNKHCPWFRANYFSFVHQAS